jgi:Transposase DDE domain/Helix-turn-helix of DDE superfamily endonuclease
VQHAPYLTSLKEATFDLLVRALALSTRHRRGRPWAIALASRVRVACAHLRTNLTLRELATVFSISKSQVHRILVDLVPRIAALLDTSARCTKRTTWIVDGTLVPTRDHRCAAKSKNYRWSCNLQVLARRTDLRIIAIDGGGPGNRNDPIHYRASTLAPLCRRHRCVLADGGYRGIPELVTPRFKGRRMLRDAGWRRHRRRRARIEHAIARLKDWRVLRDYRRRGNTLVTAARAVAHLHNLQIRFRDSS